MRALSVEEKQEKGDENIERKKKKTFKVRAPKYANAVPKCHKPQNDSPPNLETTVTIFSPSQNNPMTINT
jgi:hypothetical protein